MKRKRIAQPDAADTSSGEEYDVFLNFRGCDYRYSFVDCLYWFLTGEGVRVFLDDEGLHVGADIGDELRTAIDSSRLYIPIFSRNYASSKWCLIELARMVKRAGKSNSKEILPVFLDVEPEDVMLETDLYVKDLCRHEESFGSHKVEKWRKALREVSKMKGWNLQSNQGRGSLISKIAKHISCRVNHFIGMEELTLEIINVLDCGSRDVRFVAIHGMDGIGKTALASVVFNKIYWQFQERSFLSNVRESSAGNGIVNLQNKLLRDTRSPKPHNFSDANDAMNCIRTWLPNKRVLVVLDDVSDKDQIRNLIGMGDWLGLGSRVIITTRKLTCIANVEEIENNVLGKKIYIHPMRELYFNSSLQLLCRHCFGEDSPPCGYEQLSRDILSFTKGVPLALKVIGSQLRGRSVAIWKAMLDKLKVELDGHQYPEIWISSYEMLCDETKEIFLDAAGTSSGEEYDVFLNFRGIDIRYGFVDCLYTFLTRARIRVFLDNEGLTVRDDIGVERRTAIDSSRLYMPIFSRNYASSKWCLIELAWMVNCAQKSDSKRILPVFFDVEPEDVKLKTDLYAEDLRRHEESFGSHKVDKWLEALREVSKMKGWNLQSNMGQGSLITKIAKHISRRLDRNGGADTRHNT